MGNPVQFGKDMLVALDEVTTAARFLANFEHDHPDAVESGKELFAKFQGALSGLVSVCLEIKQFAQGLLPKAKEAPGGTAPTVH